MKLLDKLNNHFYKSRFAAASSQIRKTAPITCNKSSNVIILSQVYHGAVDMALLALKSFAYQFGQCDMEIVDDGSLTIADRELFERHLPGVSIIDITTIDVGKCPRGGTWERLVRIIELSKMKYVVQVDTDTLSIGAIPEIVSAVKTGTAFTIGNPIFNQPVDAAYMSGLANRWRGEHVQVETERKLAELKSVALQHYCRGCSALTGFPVGELTFDILEALSEELEALLGESKWREWGSEQVTSNLMISLTKQPFILPWPKYGNYGFPSHGPANGDIHTFLGKSSILHFIGSHRYSTRCYEKLSLHVINNLLGVEP